jgi:hypothetical protein
MAWRWRVFSHHSVAPPGSMRSMNEIVWWALILGNIFWGALLTYVLLKPMLILSAVAQEREPFLFYGIKCDMIRMERK